MAHDYLALYRCLAAEQPPRPPELRGADGTAAIS
jgi:hypothetical protein